MVQAKGNGLEPGSTGRDRLEQGAPEALGGGKILEREMGAVEAFIQQQAQPSHQDQQQGRKENHLGLKVQTSPTQREPIPMIPELCMDPIAQPTTDDQAHHHQLGREIVGNALQAVAPEGEAGIVVGAGCMEQTKPDPSRQGGLIGGKTQQKQQQGASNDQAQCHPANVPKGAAHATHAKLIQDFLTTVHPPSEAGPLLDEALQVDGNGHQAQATDKNQHHQGQLTKARQVAAGINDGQSRDGDRGGGCKEGLPVGDRLAMGPREPEQEAAQYDHQNTTKG